MSAYPATRDHKDVQVRIHSVPNRVGGFGDGPLTGMSRPASRETRPAQPQATLHSRQREDKGRLFPFTNALPTSSETFYSANREERGCCRRLNKTWVDSPRPSPRRWLRSKVASAARAADDVFMSWHWSSAVALAYCPYYRAYLLQKEPKRK
jgi:hypothetical protein